MFLENIIFKPQILIITVLLFILPMFVYSGINKILKYDKKVENLQKKINTNKFIASSGIIGVIIIEILCSLIILCSAILLHKQTPLLRISTNISILLFMIFLIVVTPIYHPPGEKMIPFLSNMCTFGGFLLLLFVFNSKSTFA